MRRTRNPVYGTPVSRVRIPLSPPESTPSACRTWGFFFSAPLERTAPGVATGVVLRPAAAPRPPESRTKTGPGPGEGPWTVRSWWADHATLAWLLDSRQRAPGARTLRDGTSSGPQHPTAPLRRRASLPHRDAVHVSFGLTASLESQLVSCPRCRHSLHRLPRADLQAPSLLREHAPGWARDGPDLPRSSTPARSNHPGRQGDSNFTLC